MTMVWPLHRRFVAHRGGSVAITGALVMAALLGFSAIALDGGLAYTHKRRQQTATDLAALAAVRNLASATSVANLAVTANGFAPADIATLETGIYRPDTSTAAAQRFTPTSTGQINAVRLTMSKQHPFLFGNVMAMMSSGLGLPSAMVTTRSVAATRDLAAFSIGSGLVTLDNGIVNSVLSSLIGTSVSLSAMDYQNLATTNVDLFSFSNALATRAGITTGTYNTLASAVVTSSQAIGALSDVVGSSAMSAIRAAIGANASSFLLGNLISYGTTGSLSLHTAGPLSATVSALDLVSTILQASNGGHQVQTMLNVSLPGIAAASLKLAIGEPAIGSSLIAIGMTTTRLTTAQTRLRLSLQLLGPPAAPMLSVQIAFDLAPGTATPTGVQCPAGPSSASVQLGVTPGLAQAWIGTVSDQDLVALSTPLRPPPATLVNVAGLLRVTGTAQAAIANTTATTVSFTAADIAAVTRKTVSTTDYLVPLLTTLFSSLQLGISLGSFSVVDPTALNLAILQTLIGDVRPIDQLLASVFSVLGVSVGNATVWVSGVQCGQPVLVN